MIDKIPAELVKIAVADRRGAMWDLYLYSVRAEWLDTVEHEERLTYWIEWVGLPPGTPVTRQAMEDAASQYRTVGLRVPSLYPSHDDGALGHAFWFYGGRTEEGNRSGYERPFAPDSDAERAIRAHAMVLADALLAHEADA